MGTQMERFKLSDVSMKRPVPKPAAPAVRRMGPERYWRIGATWRVGIDEAGALWVARPIGP